MKTFVNNTINELTTNEDINKHSLVKVLVESVNNTIKMGGGLSSAYTSLKKGLTDINEHLKNDSIATVLGQFEKFESSDESRLIEMNSEVGLISIIEKIKSSDCYSDPVVMHKTTVLENSLSKGYPEFKHYGSFLNSFLPHTYDNVIKESVEYVTNYLNNNQEKLLVLDAIYEMNYSGRVLYEDQIEGLSKMLINESYSSEAIKLKLNGELPVLNKLYKTLALHESARNDKFTIGNGNSNCKVTNTIVPSIKLDESGLLFYMDNKFMSIANKTKNNKKDSLSIGKKSIIKEISGDYIKENFKDFYKLCESFHMLNFQPNESGNGIVSNTIRNMVLEFKVEEDGNLNLYLNENLIKDPSKFNFSEVLVLEKTDVKNRVANVLQSINSIFNFEFIKTISNNVSRKEAYIIEANGDYHVCEKLNQVERSWKKEINEYKLYNYVLENFKYDISPIFKVKIDEATSKIKEIENRKVEIKSNINVLEESITKITTTLSSGEIDERYSDNLENIREQLEKKIISLKEAVVTEDLKKKELAQ
jgi:hypothetical protein